MDMGIAFAVGGESSGESGSDKARGVFLIHRVKRWLN